MKRNKLNLIAIAAAIFMFSTVAFADIRVPLPTPQPTPAPMAADEAQMAVSVSRGGDAEATLVISRSLLNRINAAEQAGKPAASAGAFTSQTIVVGLFISLAFVFGGVWLARSKGAVSKPAIGIVVLAVVGMGATLAIGNIAPPRRIGLDADILDKKMVGRIMASGKVKIQLVDYRSGDEVMLLLPQKKQGTTSEEE